MIDVPAAPAVPAPVTATAAVSAVAPAPIATTVTDVPDKIAQLVRQIQVTATVAQPPDGSEITLSSAIGNLTVLLPQLAKDQQQQLTQQLLALFQSQKPLNIVVQPGDPPTQAYLLLPAATGNSANTAQAGTAQQALNVITTNLLLQSANQVRQPLSVGLTLPAIVLPPNISLPSDGAVTGQPPVLPGAQEPVLNPAQTASAVTPQPGAASSAPLLQPGNAVGLNINAIFSPLETNLPTPGPNQILATVNGSGPNGQLILKAGANTLYVNQPIDVPTGTNLLLTVEPPKAVILTPLSAPGAPGLAALRQFMANLTEVNPQLAQQVLQNIIPQPGAALPGALLFFMSAFKQGNVRNWVGSDAVDSLIQAGKFELVGKLSQEMDSAGQTAHDAVVGEWKSYPVPLYNNQQFQIMNFYVHNNAGRNDGRAEGAGKAGNDHMRFLIEMRMSMLGSMQLDGFIQPKKLDMIVRSEKTLPEGMHQELRQTYTRTLSGIDYAGSLNFQVGRQHWLNIQQNAASAGTVVT